MNACFLKVDAFPSPASFAGYREACDLHSTNQVHRWRSQCGRKPHNEKATPGHRMTTCRQGCRRVARETISLQRQQWGWSGGSAHTQCQDQNGRKASTGTMNCHGLHLPPGYKKIQVPFSIFLEIL